MGLQCSMLPGDHRSLIQLLGSGIYARQRLLMLVSVSVSEAARD